MYGILILIIVLLSCAGCTGPDNQNAPASRTIDGITIPTTTGSPTPAEARQIAAAAYVYGYPLVFIDVWKDHQTAVASPDLARGMAPVNQLVRMYRVQPTTGAGAANNPMAYPNTDFSNIPSWLNLTKEPMVLSIPAADDRYYVVQLMDAWMDDFSSLGPRTTGNGPGNFALVGPGWNGTLPSDVIRVQAPTNTVWIGMRTPQTGTGDPAAASFLDNVILTPLSAWGTNYTPPGTVPVTFNGTANPLISTSIAQIAGMAPAEFYGYMAALMAANPPHPADGPVVDQIARIGIVPGMPFDWSGRNATMQDAIAQGYQDGISQVNAAAASWPGVPVVNGWLIPYTGGAYGTRYALRAGMAYASPLYNLPQDALYMQSMADAAGVPYSGANTYVMHFAANSTPPVNAFWSVTLYDRNGRPVPNPMNRYEISPRLGNLTYNPDGSLDIYIRQASPGPEKESNWLPAPQDTFQFVLRMYWPQESALNGSWLPPAVQMVGPAMPAMPATTPGA
jgi:hypothetical protein